MVAVAPEKKMGGGAIISDRANAPQILTKINQVAIPEEQKSLAETFAKPQTFSTLQEVVDNWLANYAHGEVGIEVFNVNAGSVVASYRSTAQMRPKSIYKLFYLYDAYAQIDAGLDDPNQPYTDGYTLGQCLDVTVRYSNNPCPEKMYDDPARSARVAQLIRRVGLANTWPDGLMTSAHDVSLFLQFLYWHPDWSASSWAKVRETMLNQPYLYRKGLPSGFTTAAVYDKAGWGDGRYNDAAMVEFPNGARYIVVVMTTNTSYTALAALGRMLERTMLTL